MPFRHHIFCVHPAEKRVNEHISFDMISCHFELSLSSFSILLAAAVASVDVDAGVGDEAAFGSVTVRSLCVCIMLM